MDDVIAGMKVGLVAGAVAGAVAGLGVLVYARLSPVPKCPGCGEQLPKARKPANRRQVLWGGWTCPRCGCEVDRRGRKVEG